MITIDHNVPIPKFAHEPDTNAFVQALIVLEKGYSFEYRKESHTEIIAAIAVATWQLNYERKFATYPETPYKSRVWRIQ